MPTSITTPDQKKEIFNRIYSDPTTFNWVCDTQILMLFQNDENAELIAKTLLTKKILTLKIAYQKELLNSEFWQFLEKSLGESLLYNFEENKTRKLYELRILKIVFNYQNSTIPNLSILNELTNTTPIAEIFNEILPKIKNSNHRHLLIAGNRKRQRFMQEKTLEIHEKWLPSNIRGAIITGGLFLMSLYSYREKNPFLTPFLLVGCICLLNLMYDILCFKPIDNETIAKMHGLESQTLEKLGQFNEIIIKSSRSETEKIIRTPFPTEWVNNLDNQSVSTNTHQYITKELGFSTKQFKEMQLNNKKQEKEKVSIISAKPTPTKLSCAGSKLTQGVKNIGDNSRFYFAENLVREQMQKVYHGGDLKRQLNRFKAIADAPRFVGQRGHGLKTITYFNHKPKEMTIFILGIPHIGIATHEMKIDGDERVVCIKLNDEPNTYIGCWYLEKGLHTSQSVESFLQAQPKLLITTLQDDDMPENTDQLSQYSFNSR